MRRLSNTDQIGLDAQAFGSLRNWPLMRAVWHEARLTRADSWAECWQHPRTLKRETTCHATCLPWPLSQHGGQYPVPLLDSHLPLGGCCSQTSPPLFISLLRFPSPSSMSLCLENLILSQTSTAPLECDPIHIPLANFGNPEHKFQPPSLGHILGFLAKHPWSSSSSLFTTARRGPWQPALVETAAIIADLRAKGMQNFLTKS